MGKHVKVGDRLEVVFAPAYRSVQTQTLINGRRAYATDSGPTPLVDDRWEVMVVGMDHDRTVYFVEPLNLVEAADGLGDVLKPYAPFYHEYIRTAEGWLQSFLSNVGYGDADDEADALDEILSDGVLPPDYKEAVWSRFEAQRACTAAG
jgi:hypothetical protein